jgi:queuine tRNA-ribosyltransferase
MMMLDDCTPYPCEYEYAKQSMQRTHQWAKRGRDAFSTSDSLYEHQQFQFGIVQGSMFKDLRRESATYISELNPEGIAIGVLSVGEPTELMYEMMNVNTDIIPQNKPRYLMGVGTPANLLQSIARGIDMFDCVLPTRNGRNGQILREMASSTSVTRNGKIIISYWMKISPPTFVRNIKSHIFTTCSATANYWVWNWPACITSPFIYG